MHIEGLLNNGVWAVENAATGDSVDGSHHQDRNVSGAEIVLQLFEHLGAAHVRHHHVQKNYVWPICGNRLQGLAAIGGKLHRVALIFQDHSNGPAQ